MVLVANFFQGLLHAEEAFLLGFIAITARCDQISLLYEFIRYLNTNHLCGVTDVHPPRNHQKDLRF
jgi:hypothetical protein